MGGGMTVLAFLRSRTLTVWLVGLFILYYLTMAVWAGEAFSRYVSHLSSSNFFRAFYLLFLVNVVLRVVDSCRASWPAKARFFLQLPLLAGLVVLLFSFFLSLNMRKTHWAPPVGVGDAISVPWEARSYRIETVAPALEKKVLRTDNDARLFDYEPGLTMMSTDGERYAIGAFPPRKAGSTYFHVLLFGIGPGIELRKNNELVSKGYMALRLISFGSVDTFEIQPFPYKFHLSIIPNRILKKGKETARDYDLEKPMYRVEIVKGDSVIAKAETETSVRFDGDMELSFFEPDDWVLLEIVYDPFVIWFVAGLAMLVVGVILYPFTLFPRK